MNSISVPPLPTRGGGAGRSRLHPRRSRNGCLTCKRRKVRCNEQRPHCYHCRRLDLECVWKDTPTESGNKPTPPAPTARAATTTTRCPAEPSVVQEVQAQDAPAWPSPSADMFNFAHSSMDPTEDYSLFQEIYLRDLNDSIQVAPRHLQGPPPLAARPSAPVSTSVAALLPEPSPRAAITVAGADLDDDDALLLYAPPIMDPVENGPICASLRALLDGMASSSPMVRHAMAAFAAVQFCPAGDKVDYRQYYDKATEELTERFHQSGDTMTVAASSQELGHILTTIFFLTYINFLTGRLDLAYSNLAKAHTALQTSNRGALGSLEQRIIAWIRWSDARAALAGGEGLLVNDTSVIYPSSPSTCASTSSPGPDSGPQRLPTSPDTPAHEVIYSMLSQPGIAFFQEVQTITGRITRIAHNHRSRGSVEDETEVMAIAAGILRDLSALYDRRPALMDHAVSGTLGGVLCEPLASTVVRSFQTYLANFSVCYIHLHRVAHRHLARSEAVTTGLRRIKEVAHCMVDSGESIPVSMLWPLFLWGSEEDDPEECRWILETIRGLRHVATNANMAADVLQEIQRRQREAGARVDIRSVCVEMFDATFAII